MVYARINGGIRPVMEAEVTPVVRLPFVHRIALTGRPGSRKLIAAALCGGKDSVDDWSKPGAVYEYLLDDEMQITSQRRILDGITRNHGMYTYEKQGGSYLLVSGDQGVWAIDEAGSTKKFCEEAISDLCMFDVDGDGIDEIVCIAPFHGDAMKVYKMTEGGWTCIAQEKISFGHAVWSGLCGGKTMLLSCSRSGDKCTRIYRPGQEEGFCLEQMNVDEGVGASNICVKEMKGGQMLYAANHELGEVARYYIEI